MIRFFRVDSRPIILICVDLRNLRLTGFCQLLLLHRQIHHAGCCCATAGKLYKFLIVTDQILRPAQIAAGMNGLLPPAYDRLAICIRRWQSCVGRLCRSARVSAWIIEGHQETMGINSSVGINAYCVPGCINLKRGGGKSTWEIETNNVALVGDEPMLHKVITKEAARDIIVVVQSNCKNSLRCSRHGKGNKGSVCEQKSAVEDAEFIGGEVAKDVPFAVDRK